MFNVLFCFIFFFKDGTSRDEEDNSINNMREVENNLEGNSEEDYYRSCHNSSCLSLKQGLISGFLCIFYILKFELI